LQKFIISVGLNHDSYYSMKKAGNLPRADEALIIAKALGTTVEYLVEGIGTKPATAEEVLSVVSGIINHYNRSVNKSRNRSSGNQPKTPRCLR